MTFELVSHGGQRSRVTIARAEGLGTRLAVRALRARFELHPVLDSMPYGSRYRIEPNYFWLCTKQPVRKPGASNTKPSQPMLPLWVFWLTLYIPVREGSGYSRTQKREGLRIRNPRGAHLASTGRSLAHTAKTKFVGFTMYVM